jgi:hypothetical protein
MWLPDVFFFKSATRREKRQAAAMKAFYIKKAIALKGACLPVLEKIETHLAGSGRSLPVSVVLCSQIFSIWPVNTVIDFSVRVPASDCTHVRKAPHVSVSDG